MQETQATPSQVMAEQIHAVLMRNGPLWSLENEWCNQAFQQAHAVRAMLAVHRIEPCGAYVDEAVHWAEMTLRLQGTAGHPDAYNMGYGYRIDRGVPRKWYVADCGTIAVTLLDVAVTLGLEDERSQRYLKSVRRFTDHIIERWSMPDGSFALGYDEFRCLDQAPYHCAVQQSNLFLWPLAQVTGESRHRERATQTASWMANDLDFDSAYYGGAIHNRGYGGESMLVALAHLDPSEDQLRAALDARLRDIAEWSIVNFGGAWFRDRDHGSAKDPLLLMVLQHCRDRWADLRESLGEVVDAGYAIMDRVISNNLQAVRKHQLEGMAIASIAGNADIKACMSQPKFFVTDGLSAMALAARQDAFALYPMTHAPHWDRFVNGG